MHVYSRCKTALGELSFFFFFHPGHLLSTRDGKCTLICSLKHAFFLSVFKGHEGSVHFYGAYKHCGAINVFSQRDSAGKRNKICKANNLLNSLIAV